ncbi:MAG: hypothetical protein ACRDO8_03100 [Nocardioidaceae bacterium]
MSFGTTPNAEKYVLEADAMRRRQLRSALLHGSSRTWREHRRVWPAIAVGIILTAVVIAGITLKHAISSEDAADTASTATTSRSDPRAVYVDLRSLSVGDQLLRSTGT